MELLFYRRSWVVGGFGLFDVGMKCQQFGTSGKGERSVLAHLSAGDPEHQMGAWASRGWRATSSCSTSWLGSQKTSSKSSSQQKDKGIWPGREWWKLSGNWELGRSQPCSRSAGQSPCLISRQMITCRPAKSHEAIFAV